MNLYKATRKRRLVAVPRIITELELRTVQRYEEALLSYKIAKKEGKLAYRDIVKAAFGLIPKAVRNIRWPKSKKLIGVWQSNPNKKAPIHIGVMKGINKGMYSREEINATAQRVSK